MKYATLTKTLVGAVSVMGLAFAAPTFAAPISDDGMGVGGAGVLTGTGAGNLFLTVQDTVRNQAIIINLGRNVLSDATNPANWSSTDAAANTALATFIAGATTNSNLIWNVAGITNKDASGIGAPPYNQLGLITTNQGQTDFGANGFGAFTAGLSNVGNYLTAVNATNGLAASNSVLVGSGQVNAYPSANEYNGSFGWLSFDNRATGTSGSQFLSYVYSGGDPGVDPGIAETIVRLGSIAINAATGVVSFTAGTVSAVPLPGAVWLLGSALLGLGGVSRRKAIAVA
jgi:hypothetical protein